MMRKLPFLILLSFYSIVPMLAQLDCGGDVPEEVAAQYRLDAEQLAARYINGGLFTTDTVEVELADYFVNPIHDALLAVYQSSDLPHWEEVIEQFEIHANPTFPTQRIHVLVDTAYLFTKEIRDEPNGFGSGNLLFDRIAQTYGLQNFGEQSWQSVSHDSEESYRVIPLQSAKNIYLPALISKFNGVQGVVDVVALDNPDLEYTKDITYTDLGNYSELTYRFSWDCDEDGLNCKNDHYWTYHIAAGCKVTFIEEAGATLPISEISALLSTGLYPNPTSDEFVVQVLGPAGKEVRVVLFSALGQIIQSKIIQSNSGLIQLGFSLEDQPVGMYFLGLVIDGKVLTEKILKR